MEYNNVTEYDANWNGILYYNKIVIWTSYIEEATLFTTKEQGIIYISMCVHTDKNLAPYLRMVEKHLIADKEDTIVKPAMVNKVDILYYFNVAIVMTAYTILLVFVYFTLK